jgi:hypothetical protein
MTTKRILLIAACIVIALGGMWALCIPHYTASELMRHYVLAQIPDSLQILEFERRGHREWTAFFHFRVAPADFPKLLEENNPVSIDPDTVHPDDFASLAVRRFKMHLPDTDLAKSYEMYSLQRTNRITENYLLINKVRSEGFIVIIRY